MTQVDVFKDNSLLNGVNLCSNQFDLLENFQIIGQGLNVSRKENMSSLYAMQINKLFPYVIDSS